MKRIIYYNLIEASYFIKLLAQAELAVFERNNPQLIPLDIPENNINEKLVRTLNYFMKTSS